MKENDARPETSGQEKPPKLWLSRLRKAIVWTLLCLIAVYVAALGYFAVAGRDIDSTAVESVVAHWMPPKLELAPEDNAYLRLKEFSERLPDNKTKLCSDGKLRKAYLDGETNRVELAADALEYIQAEKNTFDMVRGVLSSRGIDVPGDEADTANQGLSLAMRACIAYRVRATREAAGGDVAAGRETLLELYRFGRFLAESDSLVYGLSKHIGDAISQTAVHAAAEPLFAPEDDEAWLVRLRGMCGEMLDGDSERMKWCVARYVPWFRRHVRALAKDDDWLWMSMMSSNSGLLVASGLIPGTPLPPGFLASAGRDALFGCLMLCPTYRSYCFQPNRTTVDYIRGIIELFCKIDEGTYDMEYAKNAAVLFPKPVRRPFADLFIRNCAGRELLSVPEDSYSAFYRQLFTLRADIAVLACLSYRARHGVYPQDLDSLVPEFIPEVPRDPFDGEKLRYRADKGYVWTRGKDGLFDGVVELGPDGKPNLDKSGYHWVRMLRR